MSPTTSPKASSAQSADTADALPGWTDFLGQERLLQAIGIALRKDRLTGSVLLVGPRGVGKTTLAMLLARTLLCERVPPSQMDPCGRCPGCAQVAAGTHPDLIEVRKPENKTLLPVELLIGRREFRMREGFCHDVHLRPMQGRRKVAILHDADYLNEEGANCLLKTLEEPPGDSLILVIGTSEQRQLPTIRSRCQILRLVPPDGSVGAALLRRQIEQTALAEGQDEIPSIPDDSMLSSAISLAAGDFHVARRMVMGQSDQIRAALLAELSQDPPDPIALIRLLNDHLSRAGKETSARRDALRDAGAIIVEHYRDSIRQAADGAEWNPDALTRLDRALRMFRELDRSANLSTLVECLATDLTLARTGDRGGIG